MAINNDIFNENQNKNAITIPDASREVVCEVLDIMHLNEIE